MGYGKGKGRGESRGFIIHTPLIVLFESNVNKAGTDMRREIDLDWCSVEFSLLYIHFLSFCLLFECGRLSSRHEFLCVDRKLYI